MKAIIIARVSTEEQKEAGNSLPAQITRLEKYCHNKGFEIIKIFSFDESAYKTKRDDFDEILDYILKQKEKVAVCFDKVDRLSRNVFDKRVSTLYERALQDKNELHFASDGQVINNQLSAVEKFQFGMSLGLAKYYSDAISDNVKRAIENKIRNGEWPGRPPFGYKNITINKDKRDIITDPLNSKIVKLLFTLYSTRNHSFDSLRQKLRDDYKLDFSNGHISKILDNTFYYGIMLIKGKYYPHKYEKIIDKNLFDMVQEIRNGFNKKRRKILALPAIYRGRLFCATCGCAVSPEMHKGHFYYQCTESKGKHGAKMLSEVTINTQITQLFDKIQLPQKTINDLLIKLKNLNQNKSDFRAENSRRLYQEREMYSNRKEALLNTLLDQRITGDEFDKYKVEYDRKITDIDVQLQSLDQAEDKYYSTIEQVIKLTSRAKEIFESSEAENKRRLVGIVLSNLKVDGKNIVSDWVKPFNLIAKFNDHTLGLASWNDFRTISPNVRYI